MKLQRLQFNTDHPALDWYRSKFYCGHNVLISNPEPIIFYIHYPTTIHNGNIVYGQKFHIEFYPDLYVLRSPDSKIAEGGLNNHLCVCVCAEQSDKYVCVCVRGIFVHHIFKTKKRQNNEILYTVPSKYTDESSKFSVISERTHIGHRKLKIG